MHISLTPPQISFVYAAIQLWPAGGSGASQQGAGTEEGVAQWIKLPGKGLP